MNRERTLVLLALCFCSVFTLAGGPTLVGGPAVGTRPPFGIDGHPFIWNPAAMPIAYRVDPGPMAATATGTVVISNAIGISRVQSMFGVWQSVSTASVSFTNAGSILPAGSFVGGDVKTLAQYNDVLGSCRSGLQNPIIFDADSSIISGLGLPPEVIGFSSGCRVDTTNGFLVNALVLMNGKMQDGVSTSNTGIPNYELTANEFDEAITHEIGHFIGLDHSQINLDLLQTFIFPCELDGLAGLPLMFPINLCQARKDAGLPLLSPDDVAWVSRLYPGASQPNAYGTISGRIYFSDGVTQLQGLNVIARFVDDPNTPEDESRRHAISVVSGFLFTGNPGQAVTAALQRPFEDNSNGDASGSRNSQLIGYYEIPVPPGTYTVEVECIDRDFQGGSSVGPLSVPIFVRLPSEFWSAQESAYDFPLQRDTITVHAGETVSGTDIILNNSDSRFDQFEDSSSLQDSPPLPSFPAEERGDA